MNRPQGLNAFLFPSTQETREMGTVEVPSVLRILRPATLVLWLIIFAAQAQAIVVAHAQVNWLVVVLATALFVGIYVQFWYEESERGRNVHRTIERMRGRIYEDEATGMPNSRHFVFELRRQMMRSVRNGRGFSLVLTDLVDYESAKKEADRALEAFGRPFRQALGEGDFCARLQGGIFAAIVVDDRERTAADKADAVFASLRSLIPPSFAGTLRPVVSITGYQGELEVRDFLRRAQRDLIANRSRGVAPSVSMASPRAAGAA